MKWLTESLGIGCIKTTITSSSFVMRYVVSNMDVPANMLKMMKHGCFTHIQPGSTDDLYDLIIPLISKLWC